MFFTAIHQMMTESVDLTIVIRKTNGQLTVSTLPKSNGLKDEAQNHIVPLTVTGTP
jgi:PRTRC genetic system protein E